MHTGSNWFTPSDIRGSIFDPPADANGQPDVRYALRLGHLDGIEGDAPLAYFRNAALATIAPPGAGKTQCQVIPNLLSWQGPAFVLDVKGELYQNTAGYRAKHFGPVYKFDVFDSDTHGFNPFSFLHDDPAQLWDDASFLADMMFLPTGGHDQFWELSAKRLLHGTLAAMVFDEEERSFDYVLDTLATKERLSGMVNTLEDCEVRQFVRMGEQIKELLDESASRTMAGILQHTYASLQNLASPGIHAATGRNDWTPESLRAENATVYVVLKAGQVDEYAALLRLILGLHLRALTSKPPERGAVPILFMLDEMPQLRYMRPVEDTLDLGRQYGIRLWMFTQSMKQITDHYGDAGGFLSKCAMQMYMNPDTVDETAQAISQALGTRESVLDGSTVPMLEANELTGPNYEDQIIIMAQGSHPVKLTKQMAWQNPEMVKRMQIPPPKRA